MFLKKYTVLFSRCTLYFFFIFFINKHTCAQSDSLIYVDGVKVITLSPVVAGGKMDIASFIQTIQHDTSFYQAFKNLRVINYDALNDIRMLDKKGNIEASMNSLTRQQVRKGCRFMQTLQEKTTGTWYDTDGSYQYYTMQMYASLFFTKDTICGETNVINEADFSTQNTSGIEKHKRQLKQLFFNPGKRINGIPFLSNKTAIYSDYMAKYYNFSIDIQPKNGINCYVYTQTVKDGYENNVAIEQMKTWINTTNNLVVAKNYTIKYAAGIYSFDVNMDVEMGMYQQYIVPTLIRYTGNWKVLFKSQEKGLFTATLFNFSK